MSEKVVGTTQSALDASTATTWSKVVSKHKNGDEMLVARFMGLGLSRSQAVKAIETAKEEKKEALNNEAVVVRRLCWERATGESV